MKSKIKNHTGKGDKKQRVQVSLTQEAIRRAEALAQKDRRTGVSNVCEWLIDAEWNRRGLEAA